MRSLAILTLSMMVALTAFGDDITVTDFTSGTTISSSDMNSNFDVVVAESNENDARIEANETSIASLTTTLQGKTYQWAGYTSANYVGDGPNPANGYNLSRHCKAEFGESSSVANLKMLEGLVRGGSLFPSPSTDYAWVLPGWDFVSDNASGFNTFFGVSGNVSAPCAINGQIDPSLAITCSESESNSTPRQVACVTES